MLKNKGFKKENLEELNCFWTAGLTISRMGKFVIVILHCIIMLRESLILSSNNGKQIRG
jgi:hypothetical protein